MGKNAFSKGINQKLFHALGGASLPMLSHFMLVSYSITRFMFCTGLFFSQWLTDYIFSGLSHAANATSEFRFINQRNPIIIGREDDNGKRMEALEELFEQGPGTIYMSSNFNFNER